MKEMLDSNIVAFLLLHVTKEEDEEYLAGDGPS